ncbi:N-methyl-L-tryptophan oxidase [Kribbella sp. CA-245084]|uniref:N-methyl-L-tryptophan oxidase n=1 Tax=Kribbella sp. CA-245084 TaxID=3239940 RepID=UPI003D8AFABC
MTAEVAVVGLGAIGSMALWRLAERGVRVHGYEQFGLAHDQGASAGETRRFSVQSQGDPRFTPLAVEALELWRELSDGELFRQTGGVIIGPEGTPAIASALASAREYGLPYESLAADELRSRFRQHVVRDHDVGVTDPLAGYLRPEASVAAAVGRARALGAEVSLETEIVAVESRPDGVAVVTRGGSKTYERVILAPGAWAGGLVPGAAGMVVPRRLVQGWYPAKNPADYRPEVFGVFERVGDISAYGFPSLDGATVKVGVKFGTHPVVDDLRRVDRVVDQRHLGRLAEAIHDFFPGLRPEPAIVRTGIEGYSPDGRPLLGPTSADHRIVVACGFSGSGFKFAPVMGDIAADFATTGSTGRKVSFLAAERQPAAGRVK